ncbi:hypothetical protein [Rhodanobacter denitrificans]|nr:hypothetical protein [Rhodanobacter denitrificans]UJJ51046.1 hypothetical protein LRK52_17720 [Rhodanobacter denitrificans]UJM90258.1 hypothetical protein LRK24_17820 [Rhodanobacter denitrificans]UJM93792.1 hypothetical protein LRK32_17790 [Rhodanobacter denitrificans]UJM97323.1 hypothetical protein LRK44_17805 [Rhodanobacter denitrificans]UJN23262.1 hypothetical protein LRK54_08830 [Rhodanobacter denitrificans]
MTATDDQIVNARRERFRAHLPDSDDLALITLKGHLLVEEILDDIIAHHCKNPTALAGSRMGFQLKAQLARALVGDDSLPQQLWPMLDALRVLRNELAHKLDSPKLEKVVSKFIAATYGAVGQVDQGAPVALNLRLSMGYMYGYLAAYEYRVRTGTVPPKLVDA